MLLEVHGETFHEGGSKHPHVSTSTMWGTFFFLVAEARPRGAGPIVRLLFRSLLKSCLLTPDWLEQVTWLSPMLRRKYALPTLRPRQVWVC